MIVDATIQWKGIDTPITTRALIDTGSDQCVCGIQTIGEHSKRYLSPTRQVLRGVSELSIKAVGEIRRAVLVLGKAKFRDIDILVVDEPIPFLIGKNLLFSRTVSKFTIYQWGIEFHRIFGKRRCKYEAEFVKESHVYSLAAEYPKNLDTVAKKVEWLADNRELQLPKSHTNTMELEQIADLLIEYNDVFGYEGSELGTFDTMVRIPTKPGEVRAVRQHPIAKQFQERIDSEIEKMLQQKVIEPCKDNHGFNSPIIIVEKKDGEPRVCANFKNTLNKCLTEGVNWQMPETETTMMEIGRGNTFFGSLDFKAGYWQVVINPADRYKTSFQWKNKCFQFIRLPFGLACAGDIFCRSISSVLSRVPNQQNFKSYVDDLCVYSKEFGAYFNTIEAILKECRKSGIKLNAKKCKLLRSEAEFLGRIITTDGFKPNPEYVAAVKNMAPPTTRKELQSCLGRLNWLRKFIETQIGEEIANKCFANLMNTLNKLNRKDRKFSWSAEANEVFVEAKSRLSSENIIHYAEFNQPFLLVTDASNIAIGCAIMQRIDGKQRIVAVGSKTLNKTQENWSTTEREAFAIIWAVEKYEYFLRGPEPFILLTDHKSLIFLDRNIFANQKIARWQDRLKQFRFICQFVPGHKNELADMLSRPFGQKKMSVTKEEAVKAEGKFYRVDGTALRVYIPSWICESVPRELLLLEEEEVNGPSSFLSAAIPESTTSAILDEFLDIAEQQKEDRIMIKIINYLKSKVDLEKWKFDCKDHRDRLYSRHRKLFRLDPNTELLTIDYHDDNLERIVVPTKLRPYYLRRGHDDNGHFGQDRVQDLLWNVWWPGMGKDIENYVQSCVICSKRKGNYGRNAKPLMGHLLKGEKPFEVIYTDFVHMPQSKTGKRYILTIICSFTRFFYGYATCRDRACDAARGLLEFMLEYDVPKVISSDRGTHFVNSIIEELCENMGIKQNLHTAYRPQSSGSIERMHRTMKNSLWALAADRKCTWVEALPYVRKAMNAAKCTSTGCSPYYAVYGREPVITGISAPGSELRSNEALSYGASVQTILQKAHALIRLTNDEADRALENRENPVYPADELATGEEAYLHRPQSASAKESHMPWIGPFTILKSNGSIVQIDRNGTPEWVHRFHLSRKIERRPSLEVGLPPIDNEPSSLEHETGEAEEHASQEEPDTDWSEDVMEDQPTQPRRSSRRRRPPRRLSPRSQGQSHAIRD